MGNRTTDIPLDATNKSKSIDLFYKRFLFRKEAYSYALENIGCLRDFSLYENNLYGRVDGSFSPRNPDGEKMTLVGDRHLAFDFVARAFDSFKLDILEKKSEGLFASDFKHVNNLEITPSYLDANVLFEINFVEVTNKIVRSIKRSQRYQKYMTSYPVYLKNVFFPLLKQITQQQGITFSSYMMGAETSLLCTGLAIDIADLDASSDQAKIDNFISKGGFNHYLKAASKANFYVDKNVPWRLIFKIGGTSSNVRDYFYNYTIPSERDDINILKNLSVDVYNKFVNERGYVIVDSDDGRKCQRKVVLSRIGDDVIEQHTRLSLWISEYIRIKNVEANHLYNDSEVEIIINKFERSVTDITLTTVLHKVNEFFNYPEANIDSFNAALLRKKFIDLGKSLDNFPDYVKLVVKQDTFGYY